MFEKEAEEIVKRNVCEDCNRCQSHGYIGCDIYRYSKDSCLYGLREGYNKANEWHYVKDGDLPKENKPLLCVRGGNIYIAWYYNGVYHDNRCCQVKKPYAWKEIVLPKEA